MLPARLRHQDEVLSHLSRRLRSLAHTHTFEERDGGAPILQEKETFRRLALSDHEACLLFNGECRSLCLLVIHTGLRRGEINALRWRHIHLDRPNPFYALPANSSRNRKEQPRLLHPELVAELKRLKANGVTTADAALFPDGVPSMS